MLASCGIVPLHAANKSSDYTQDLLDVRTQIKHLQSDTTQTQQERLDINKKLEGIASQISIIEQKKQSLEQQIDEHRPRNLALTKRKNELRLLLEKQTADLQTIIEGSLAVSRINFIKVLFTQDDPKKLLRTIRYYRYLTQARAQETREIYQLIEELDETESKLSQGNTSVMRLSQELTEQHRELQQIALDLTTMIAALDHRIVQNQSALKTMNAEEKRLVDLLVLLEENKDSIVLEDEERFVNHKGKLALPLKARVKARFGEPKSVRGAVWKGILLETPEGNEVQSIFTGQVVFADQFRGLGLLVIVDHNDGFMSLYAHNSELKVRVNDRVEAGQIIAITGTSGSEQKSGLYF